MRTVAASIAGCAVALVVYMFVWFFARNIVGGTGGLIETIGFLLAMLIALKAGILAFFAVRGR